MDMAAVQWNLRHCNLRRPHRVKEGPCEGSQITLGVWKKVHKVRKVCSCSLHEDPYQQVRLWILSIPNMHAKVHYMPMWTHNGAQNRYHLPLTSSFRHSGLTPVSGFDLGSTRPLV